MINRISFLICFVLSRWLFSCSSSLAKEEMSIGTECWSLVDTLSITYTNQDTHQVLNMEFPFVFTDDYPFNNIYFNLRVGTPAGQVNDLPLSFQLMDSEGNWYGESSGEEVKIEFDLGNMLVLNQLGEYSFKLYHYMREDNICGLKKAGITLNTAKEGNG